MTHRDSDRKLGELALYLAHRSEGDEDFGRTKLHKLLFWSDFLAFARLGSSITGTDYLSFNHGPFAAQLGGVLSKLTKRGEASEQCVPRFRYAQKRPIALRPADLDDFSGAEIAIVEEVLEYLQGHDAANVSEMSHRFPGWTLAGHRGRIPYSAIFLYRRQLTASELEYGRELADELGV